MGEATRDQQENPRRDSSPGVCKQLLTKRQKVRTDAQDCSLTSTCVPKVTHIFTHIHKVKLKVKTIFPG